jgi:hypothetical protein
MNVCVCGGGGVVGVYIHVDTKCQGMLMGKNTQ